MNLRNFLPIAMFFLATTLSASTFVAMDSAELIEKSDRVIQGEVINTTSFWDEKGQLVVTEATIRVTENILGESNDSIIRVRTPGGRVGQLRVEAEGFPKFGRGEQVLLFLQVEEGRSFQRVLGFQQGHFEVVRRDDGVTVAVPQIDGNARYFYRNGARLTRPKSMEIEQFKTLVRDTGRALNRPVR